MNPYKQYQQQVVTTMTQGEMLIKLYDESIKQIQFARELTKQEKYAEMDEAITKSLKIIRYLRGTLDFRYPVSNNLDKLYDFFDQQLVMASVKKDVKILDDVEPLIQELKETFTECDKIDRSNRAGNVAQSLA